MSLIDPNIARSYDDSTIRGKIIDQGGEVYNVASKGASPSASGSKNTTAIQGAIDDAVAAGGGAVAILDPGTYELASVTDATNTTNGRSALTVSGADITIYLGPGVVLKWEDDAINDTDGEADMIFVESDQAGDFRLIGPGRLTGNTAGQTNWTGGYNQNGSSGVRAETQTAAGGATGDRCVVVGPQFDDFFGDAFILRDFDRFYIDDVYGFDCGEGFFAGRGNTAQVGKIVYEDNADIHVGDALEFTQLDVLVADNLIVRGTITGTPPGSAVDLSETVHATIGTLVCDGWRAGVGGSTTSDNKTPKTIDIGVLKYLNAPAGSGGPIDEREGLTELAITVGHITIHDCGGSQTVYTYSNSPPTVIDELRVVDSDQSHGDGLQVKGDGTVIIHNIDIDAPQFRGLMLVETTDGDSPTVVVNGGRITNAASSRNNVHIKGSGGGTTYSPTVILNGVDISSPDTGSGKIGVDGSGENLDNVKIINCPTTFTDSDRPASLAAGSQIFNTTSGKPEWHDGSNYIDADGTTT